MEHLRALFASAVLALIIAVACGCGGAGSPGSHSAPTSPSANLPQFTRVFLVVEENRGFSSVIGNSSMPYLNALAAQYGLATQYYGNVHPSLPNYFMLTTGQLVAPDDSFAGTISDDNIVRELAASGKSWKAYTESLPNAGYMGANVYPYVRDHNPFVYFSDVINSSTTASNMVPFTQFAVDLQNNQLPNFSFILPDLIHDAHDGTTAQADAWLQANLDPLIKSAAFQQSGLLIITFDEAEDTDITNGGGHVATIIVSPLAKKGFKSTTLYQHQSTLRLILEALGASGFPGASANAPSMEEFF
ncbi:MAG TPA: alkaline phosphatase family protein [Terriglobales bacterium]|jgi:acid phosphatase